MLLTEHSPGVPYALRRIKSATSILISIIFLFGCTAAPMPSAAKDGTSNKANKSLPAKTVDFKKKVDCNSKQSLSAKEECIALKQATDCIKDDMRCDPYIKMYFLEKRIQAILDEIEVLTAQVYARYLVDDPEYISDAILQSRNSSESWKKYRDSYCLSEQYSSGMSRYEIADIAELCRLKKTEARIVELDELLVALKSNMEK